MLPNAPVPPARRLTPLHIHPPPQAPCVPCAPPRTGSAARPAPALGRSRHRNRRRGGYPTRPSSTPATRATTPPSKASRAAARPRCGVRRRTYLSLPSATPTRIFPSPCPYYLTVFWHAARRRRSSCACNRHGSGAFRLSPWSVTRAGHGDWRREPEDATYEPFLFSLSGGNGRNFDWKQGH